MDDRYYEDDEFTPMEHLDNNERGDGAVDETWVEEYDIEYFHSLPKETKEKN